jgi:hypothetical protein
MRYYGDSFDRPADIVLDPTAYPAIWGVTAPNLPTVYARDRLRMLTTGGFKFGYGLPSPNAAIEVTVHPTAFTDMCSAWILHRYQTGGANYGLALSFITSPANVHPQDVTADTPVLAANKVYLYRFDGTDAVELDSATYAFTADTDYRVRFVINGDRLTGYINGAEVLNATDSTWMTSNWSHGTFGLGVKRTSPGSSGAAVVDFNDLVVDLVEIRTDCQAAFDGERRIIWFSLPAGGSGEPAQLMAYHVDLGVWTQHTVAVTALGDTTDARGVQRVFYGEPADGKVYQLDESATWSGNAIDAVWQSNWIRIAEDNKTALVDTVQVYLELDPDLEANLSVQVTSDPDDPLAITHRQFIARYGANKPVSINRAGRFARVGVHHYSSTSDLKIRLVKLTVLK